MSGDKPDTKKDLDLPGQMLAMKYDPVHLSFENVELLVDIIHLKLRQDPLALGQPYPELGHRFDSIKLQYLFDPVSQAEYYNNENNAMFNELKKKYYEGILDILLEQHGAQAANMQLYSWTLIYHLQNSIDLDSVSFIKVNRLLQMV